MIWCCNSVDHSMNPRCLKTSSLINYRISLLTETEYNSELFQLTFGAWDFILFVSGLYCIYAHYIYIYKNHLQQVLFVYSDYLKNNNFQMCSQKCRLSAKSVTQNLAELEFVGFWWECTTKLIIYSVIKNINKLILSTVCRREHMHQPDILL